MSSLLADKVPDGALSLDGLRAGKGYLEGLGPPPQRQGAFFEPIRAACAVVMMRDICPKLAVAQGRTSSPISRGITIATMLLFCCAEGNIGDVAFPHMDRAAAPE
eukprot:GDKK01026986.1.p3 GENE.GDKK01026986.1~~GDKK01026986.1.p3  ORF type:complete len:105 (+),score=7.65 GDKK01026986.1:517-831(+)